MRVIGLAVISIDGFLTRHDETGVSFASAEDQEHFRSTMCSCGATVMGRRTFEAVRDRIVSDRGGGILRTVMTRDPAARSDLHREGALEFTSATPREVVSSLERRGYSSLAVLGGSEVYRAFVAGNLVTEWQITVEPRLFGSGTPLIAGTVDQRLELEESRLLNRDTILLRYRVV
ncbi:MAG: dihydrofolate reductase family protein [Spirochaetota bacterium]